MSWVSVDIGDVLKTAMRYDNMTNDTKPAFDGNKIKQEVKDHDTNVLQFPDIPGFVVVSGSVEGPYEYQELLKNM